MLLVAEQGVGDKTSNKENKLNGENNNILVYVDGDNITAQDVDGTIIAAGKAETDAYQVIEAANDHLKLLGWGKLMLKSGIYEGNGNNLLPPSNIQIEGDGGSTIINNMGIEIKSRSNISIRNITFTGDAAYAVTIREGSKDILLEDLSATLSAHAWGAFIQYTNNGKISNTSFIRCRAVDNGGFGFLNDGYGNPNLIKNSTYIDCEAIRCGLRTRYNDWITGFDIAEGCNVENVKVVNCIAEQNWESGFHLEDKPNKVNVKLINCRSTDNGRSKSDPSYGAGFLVSSGTSLVGCEATNNKIGYIVTNNKNKLISLINCTDSGSTESMIFYNEVNKMHIDDISIR